MATTRTSTETTSDQNLDSLIKDLDDAIGNPSYSTPCSPLSSHPSPSPSLKSLTYLHPVRQYTNYTFQSPMFLPSSTSPSTLLTLGVIFAILSLFLFTLRYLLLFLPITLAILLLASLLQQARILRYARSVWAGLGCMVETWPWDVQGWTWEIGNWRLWSLEDREWDLELQEVQEVGDQERLERVRGYFDVER